MEENYVNTAGTSLMFEKPGFQMLLSLLVICAVMGKTPAAKSTKYHHHLKWCVKILSVVTEVFIKWIFHGLPEKKALLPYLLLSHSSNVIQKSLVLRDNIPAWVQGQKALVSKFPSFHHTHRNQLGCLGPSLGCVSPCFHLCIMHGCNFAFCIPQLPMMKASLLYLWCSCSESLSLSEMRLTGEPR